MKEHPCYALIMELNLHTLVPVPLNQQPEHGYQNTLCYLCGSVG